jgi:hypothetical protein
LADELADQRLHLLEQCRRLAAAQAEWQRNQVQAQAEAEAAAHLLVRKEQELAAQENRCRQRHDELAQLRRRLETQHAQWTVSRTAWESERARLLAEIRAEEVILERRMAILGALNQRWRLRQRHQLERLRSVVLACEQLRQELTTLRDEWLSRHKALCQEQRGLAEQSLALEHCRQNAVVQSADPSAAEKRLENLRRRWADRLAPLREELSREQGRLRLEMDRLNGRYAQLQHLATEVGAAADAAARQATARDHRRALRDSDQARLRQELFTLKARGQIAEGQIQELRDEVERLAHLLLDQAEPTSLAPGWAA